MSLQTPHGTSSKATTTLRSRQLWPYVDEAPPQLPEDDGKLTKVYDCIVKVHCIHSEPDYLMPWQRRHQTSSTSSGFVVRSQQLEDGNDDDDKSAAAETRHLRIMTNAHSVEYASLVQVQKRNDDRKFRAVVEVAANECDLAILRVVEDEDEFWKGIDTKALVLGSGIPNLQDKVRVIGYPEGGHSMSVTLGVVSRIERTEYTQAHGSHMLSLQIDAAINSGNSGGPVVNADLEVVGVAFQTLNDAENIGYVIPITIVRQLLSDVQQNGRYTGFCSLGITFLRMENKILRKSLGMTEDQSGVMVRKVDRPKKSLLEPNDVLMSVDGIPISNDGNIPFRRAQGERVAFACYMQTKFVGDKVSLQVLRDGNVITVDERVKPQRQPVHIVPSHWNNKPPPYMLLGGLVFTALSVPYLQRSEAWDDFISDNISYLICQLRNPTIPKHPQDSEEDEDEDNVQIVILSQVLAHPSNLGYEHYQNYHLTKVNGKPVRSLQHLEQLIFHDDTDTSEYIRLEFEPFQQVMVLERSTLEEVTDEVCDEHSIDKPCVFFPPKGEDEQNGGDQNVETPKASSSPDDHTMDES